MAALHDPALEALFLPFDLDELPWQPGQTLFLRARSGPATGRWPLTGTHWSQPFAPAAWALRMPQADAVDEDALPQGAFACVLVLPPRQKDEARALLARACQAAAPDGLVIVAVPNDEGAKSRQDDLARLCGPLSVRSKHHCRVFRGVPDPQASALRDAWLAGDAPRRLSVDGMEVWTRPGVFAWDKVDAASRLLAQHLPADLRGSVADFGCGWGYLSMQVLKRCPQVTSIDLFEADARALALAQRNLADARVPVAAHWVDVTAGVAQRFDAIVCNPPFHALGRGDRPDIGRAFIASAAQALTPGGRLWLVANRHLPYEHALTEGFAQVRTHAQDGGFKIIEAVRR